MRRRATLTSTGGSGSLGITLPKEVLEERNLDVGDEIVLLPSDEPDTFTLYFPPQE